MKYITKYIEVSADLVYLGAEKHEIYSVVLPDHSHHNLTKQLFLALFKEATSEESRKFQESLAIGRIDLKTEKPKAESA
jgi:hypothetical protein